MVANTVNSPDPSVSEQGQNPVETGFDVVQGAQLILEATGRWKSQTRPIQLLQALCKLTVDRPDVTAGFTARELAETMEGMRGRTWTSTGEDTSKRVRGYWSKLAEFWDEKSLGLRQAAADRSLPTPRLDRKGGGGSGNPTRYRFIWSTTFGDGVDEGPTVPPLPDAAIRYVCEDLARPGPAARIFQAGLSIDRWRRWAFATVGLAAILTAYLLFVLVLFTFDAAIEAGQVVKLLVGAGAIWWALWSTLGPIFLLPERKITSAPWWAQSVDGDRQLQWIRPSGASHGTIVATRYTARCPSCGGNVAVKSGGLTFPGRLVGRCEESPAEHVFSFDYITRSGKQLR